MNVNRRTKAGVVNPHEPHQAQFYMTSAGQKNSYAYQKLIEILVLEIITPKSAFVWGCDYRVPLHFGLLDKTFLKEIKMSSTYKDDTFARELTIPIALIKLFKLLGNAKSQMCYSVV
jgi:hypothetical protein